MDKYSDGKDKEKDEEKDVEKDEILEKSETR